MVYNQCTDLFGHSLAIPLTFLPRCRVDESSWMPQPVQHLGIVLRPGDYYLKCVNSRMLLNPADASGPERQHPTMAIDSHEVSAAVLLANSPHMCLSEAKNFNRSSGLAWTSAHAVYRRLRRLRMIVLVVRVCFSGSFALATVHRVCTNVQATRGTCTYAKSSGKAI